MSTKFDWNQFETVAPDEKTSGSSFDWNQFETVKPEISKGRSVASAPIKGLLKGTQDALALTPFGNLGPLSKNVEERVIQQALPTRDELSEKLLERGGRLAPFVATGPGGIGSKLAQAGAGALAGQLAEGAGLGELGQGIAEAIGTGVPGLVRNASKKAGSLLKGAEKSTEKLSSGLTKPRAVESKLAHRGLITPERQEKALSALDEEATKLAKQSIEKKVPLSKQIREGFDFSSKYEKDFGELKKSADKANPTIDITPVSEFLSKSSKKYRGIPKLHPEGQKVVKEISALRNQPQTSLRNLLKVYRSNNQKVKNIYETSQLSGKQQEYVEFLQDLNRKIADSFERTLPENSQWIKEFRRLNKEYGQFKNALKSNDLLKSIFEEPATPKSLLKLSSDGKMQKKLSLAVGKEGADQIVQIGKDLKLAKEAIKKIPSSKLSVWDKTLPFAIFIPGYHGLAGLAAIPKYLNWIRRAYGSLLTKPKSRKAYGEALKAILSNNLQAYEKAASEIEKSLEE